MNSRSQPSKPHRGRSTVPVSSRDRARERERASAEAAKKDRAARKERMKGKVTPGTAALIAGTLILALWILTQPLSNFYEQRQEIQRLHESIAAKQQKKEDLQERIERYKSDDYVKEQARNRLGVIENGETAFRVLDPRLQREAAGTIAEREAAQSREWYEVLWDSITEPPASATADGEDPRAEEDTHMPLQPGPEDMPQ